MGEGAGAARSTRPPSVAGSPVRDRGNSSAVEERRGTGASAGGDRDGRRKKWEAGMSHMLEPSAELTGGDRRSSPPSLSCPTSPAEHTGGGGIHGDPFPIAFQLGAGYGSGDGGIRPALPRRMRYRVEREMPRRSAAAVRLPRVERRTSSTASRFVAV